MKPAKQVENRHPVRGLFLTYSRCDQEPQALLDHLKTIDEVQEYLICREHHKDGGLHLHAWVKFRTGLTTKEFTPRLDLNGQHGEYAAARSRAAVLKYCKKEGEFITNLDESAVLSPQAKRAKQAAELKVRTVKDLMVDGTISYMSARAALFAQQILIDAYEHNTTRGIWIYGVPGAGKSHAAEHNYEGPIYKKGQDKWFDGYNGQPTIIIDDLDHRGQHLDHEIKIWADKYACRGEIKGGHVELRHHRLIITSNYMPQDIWKDQILIAAITRRFEFVRMMTVFKS